MISAFAAVVEAFRTRDMPVPTKVDIAVARVMAGKSLGRIGWQMELSVDELRDAARRVHAAKPKVPPKPVRQVVRRVW